MLEAYCWPPSVIPGEPTSLHVSTDAGAFDVEVAREGATREVVWRGPLIAAGDHATPPDAASNGCRWPAVAEIPVGPWRSGYYSVTLTAGTERADAFLVVRPAPGGPREPILLVLSTSTWNAYNDWGGPSLYTGGNLVSFERPLARGFLVKPEPARRKMQSEPDRESRWFFEWAEPLGLSVWSGGAGWWNWERPFLRWAEAKGRRRCRDQPGPRTASGRAGRSSALRERGPRRVLVVGHARRARRLHRWRGQCRDLQREHLLLAGPVRRRSPNDAVLQVPRRRGPRASAPPMSASCRACGRIGGSRDPRRARSDSRSRTAATQGTDSACHGVRCLHDRASRPLGVRGHRPALRGRARTSRFDRGLQGGRLRADHGADGLPVPTGADGAPGDLQILGTAPARLWSQDEQPSRYAHEPGELENTAMAVFGPG